MKSSTKIISILLTAGILSVFGYIAFGNSANGQTDPLLQSQVTNTAVTIPQGNTTTDQTIQSVLRQINNLDQIKLNTDIFDKPEFLALKDMSQDLPEPTDVGRPNPFAPIGVDVGMIAADPTATNNMGGIGGLPADIIAPASAVTTSGVQNVGQRSATVSASTIIIGTSSRWFEWGTNQNAINKTTKQTGTDSSFTATLTGLTANTTFYVRAAVELNGATVYGDVVQFKTAQ